MNEKIKKVKEDIETFLMENMEHQNKHIDYILVDQETNETYVLASDGADEAIEFNPLSKNYKEGFQYVPEWDYNFDYYIYNYLEFYYLRKFNDDVILAKPTEEKEADIAEWSSPVARRAHNPKVTGSNPVSATIMKKASAEKLVLFSWNRCSIFARQMCGPGCKCKAYRIFYVLQK